MPIYNIDNINFVDLQNNCDIQIKNKNIVKTFEQLYKVNNLKLHSSWQLFGKMKNYDEIKDCILTPKRILVLQKVIKDKLTKKQQLDKNV